MPITNCSLATSENCKTLCNKKILKQASKSLYISIFSCTLCSISAPPYCSKHKVPGQGWNYPPLPAHQLLARSTEGGEVITSSEEAGAMEHGEFSVDLGAHPPYHPAPEGFRFSGSDSSSDADSIMTSGSTSGGSGSGSAGAGSTGMPQDLLDKNLNIT